MANIVIPFAAVSHQPVPSVGFNNNFTEVATKFNTFAVQTDVAKVINVAHTFTVAQNLAGALLTGDLLFTDGLYDIGKLGATRPRDLFLSRNLDVGSSTTMRGNLLFSADATLDIGQAGALRPRDGFFSRNLTLGAALVVGTGLTVGAGLTVTTGDTTISAGRLLLSTAASKIVPGATSLSLRNNADTADNVIITDIGNVTVRLGITAGGSITAPISATSGSFHATPTAADPAISTSDGDIWILTSGAFKAKLNGSVRTLWHSGMVSAGYAAWTGTTNRASVFDQSTATLANVAQRLAAIQNDLMTAGILST